MSCIDDLPDRLHEGVANDDGDVGSREALRSVGQCPEVFLCQFVGCITNMELEHLSSSVWSRKGYVNSFFEPDSDK